MKTPKSSKSTRIPRVSTPRTKESKIVLFDKTTTTLECIPDSTTRSGNCYREKSPSPAASSIIIDSDKENSSSFIDVETISDCPEDTPKSKKSASKRLFFEEPNSSSSSSSSPPKAKIQKSTEQIYIPAKSFYASKTKTSLENELEKPTKNWTVKHQTPTHTKKYHRLNRNGMVNKGVRRLLLSKKSRSHASAIKWDQILPNVRHARLRQLVSETCAEQQKIDKCHEILRHGENPIVLAKPLRALQKGANKVKEQIVNIIPENFSSDSDFSDIEMKENLIETDVEVAEEEESHLSKRKFFKTGHNTNTRKQVSLFENITAQVYKGKISLMEQKKHKHRYRRRTKTVNVTFEDEQEQVNAILRSLDEMSFVEQPAANNYEDFQARLPYKTDDPEIAEQQQILLYFLYTNNILTEENFKIFIAESEQHKEEAARIVEETVLIVNNNNNNEEEKEEEKLEEQKEKEVVVNERAVSPVIELQKHDKLYPIFYKEQWRALKIPSCGRKVVGELKTPRGWGEDQLQIDAGQREFGARKCQQCGLLYTRHEPEEEELHRKFHASQQVLRFKAWIDEDVVVKYPEWAQDGRILRITESATNKKLQRLREIISIVDTELGFSTYIFPKIFVTFFAVRKQQIVGVCLVQPLEKAYKYLNIDGIDCCSTQEFPADCGISRIWVAPLHRRLRIAAKLVNAVQNFTIPNKQIPLNRIAFSAPTQLGREFAQRITGNDNFLVYQ